MEETIDNIDESLMMGRSRKFNKHSRSTRNYRPPSYFKHPKKPKEKIGTPHNPIRSYGVIAVYVPPEVQQNIHEYSKEEFSNHIRVMACQRRESVAYAVLVKGYYRPNTIRSLVEKLSSDERNRIKNLDFDVLWNDIWINTRCFRYRDDYSRAFFLFIRNREDILTAISTTACTRKDPPWEFTKGRRHPREQRVACALREFEEETHIPKSRLHIVTDPSESRKKLQDSAYRERFPRLCNAIRKSESEYTYDPPTIIDRLYGTDSLVYEYLYYVAYTDSMVTPERTNVTHNTVSGRDTTISDEVNDIKWISTSEFRKYFDNTRSVFAHESIIRVYDYLKQIHIPAI